MFHLSACALLFLSGLFIQRCLRPWGLLESWLLYCFEADGIHGPIWMISFVFLWSCFLRDSCCRKKQMNLQFIFLHTGPRLWRTFHSTFITLLELQGCEVVIRLTYSGDDITDCSEMIVLLRSSAVQPSEVIYDRNTQRKDLSWTKKGAFAERGKKFLIHLHLT